MEPKPPQTRRRDKGITVKIEYASSMPFFVKFCSDKAAYEVKLQRKIRFAMDHLKHLFETTRGYELVVYTPHITIVKSCRGHEVTFSKDGRILIKNVNDKGEAEAFAEDVLEMVLGL